MEKDLHLNPAERMTMTIISGVIHTQKVLDLLHKLCSKDIDSGF